MEQRDKDQHDVLSRLARQHSAIVMWRVFALVLLVFVLWNTFHTVEWRPNFESNSIVCSRHSWWGLREQTVRCEWRRDADFDRDPPDGWCAKYPDGKWHIFYAEEGDELVLYWPR